MGHPLQCNYVGGNADMEEVQQMQAKDIIQNNYSGVIKKQGNIE